MLIDRSHRAWALLSLISLTAATIGWTVSLKNSPAGTSGGSFSGLLFGILGTGMMLFAGLLAGRRLLRHLPFGSARFWMKGHLWLGTLCIPFILFHSGFAWGGVLEQLLWYCLAFVALSGFFGLAVQQFLPGLLWKTVPLETFEPQAPWLCDRLTMVHDLQLSDVCERQLNTPSPHLIEPAGKLVAAFRTPASGTENSRKLPLQNVSPPAVRDFFWAMAGFCKETSKSRSRDGFRIRVREDFPKLLEQLYSDLRPQTAATPPVNTATKASPDPRPTVVPVTPSAGGPVLSPLQPPRSQGAEETPAASGGAASSASAAAGEPSPSTPSPAAAPSAAAGAVPPAKLSPLELMRQKAAEKAAVAAGGAASSASAAAGEPSPSAPSPAPSPAAAPSAAAGAVPPAKLSPLELMRQKAAEKAAAAAGGVASSSSAAAGAVPPAKLSPLELMRQKAAEKAAAAAGGAASSASPAAGEPSPSAPPPTAAPSAAASAVPPAKSSPLEMMRSKPTAPSAPVIATSAGGAGASGGVKPPAAEKTQVVPPSPEEKGVLWEFYVNQVRPYLMEQGSGGAVRRSRFATELESHRVFHEQKTLLPKSLHAVLDELREAVEVRRQLERQRQLLRWMHWWLMLHVPISILLLVFLAAHVLMALRVVPWQF